MPHTAHMSFFLASSRELVHVNFYCDAFSHAGPLLKRAHFLFFESWRSLHDESENNSERYSVFTQDQELFVIFQKKNTMDFICLHFSCCLFTHVQV